MTPGPPIGARFAPTSFDGMCEISKSDQTEGQSDHQPQHPVVSRRERRIEIIAVVILSLAALATAWSGYQASLWDGLQSSYYSQASAARTEASQQRTEANQFRLADLSVLENFIDATIDGDEPVADFYSQRIRDEFRPAFDAWLALDPLENPDAPPSPMVMDEYQLSSDATADRLQAGATELFEDGETANDISDTYTLTTLLFAAVLFFAAISERFEYFPARMVLLSVASVGLVVGVIVAFGQPITTG